MSRPESKLTHSVLTHSKLLKPLGTPPPSAGPGSFLLLEDGVSFLLLEDGVSKLQLEGS